VVVGADTVGVQAVRFLESIVFRRKKERKRRTVVEFDRRSRDVPLRPCGAGVEREGRIGRRVHMLPE